MGKGEFGFVHGAPENAETEWDEKLPDGWTVTYTKHHPKGCDFIYTCKRWRGDSSSSTSWQSPKDLTHDEVRQLPRFVSFLAGKI